MTLTEPVTAITDYMLAALSIGFAIGVRRNAGAHNRMPAWFWCAAFVAVAIAAACGGTWHGFATLDARSRTLLWSVTTGSLGASIAFVIAAVHSSELSQSGPSLRWLVAGGVITLAGLIVLAGRLVRGDSFNQNDAFHVIQMAALYCLFRSARTARGRSH